MVLYVKQKRKSRIKPFLLEGLFIVFFSYFLYNPSVVTSWFGMACVGIAIMMPFFMFEAINVFEHTIQKLLLLFNIVICILFFITLRHASAYVPDVTADNGDGRRFIGIISLALIAYVILAVLKVVSPKLFEDKKDNWLEEMDILRHTPQYLAVEKTLPSLREKYISEAVQFFKKLDFFATYKGGDKELTTKIINSEIADSLGDIDIKNPKVTFNHDEDFYILSLDKNRVWFRGVSDYSHTALGTYTHILELWIDLSRGILKLTKPIEEEWKTEKGPIELHLEINGKKYSISAKYYRKYLDFTIISAINNIMKDYTDEYRYEVALDKGNDGEYAVVVLTPDEREQILKERHWRFAKDLNKV